MDDWRPYLAKAQESLGSARTDLSAKRYNSCANRVYFACFQAAIAALLRGGIRPAALNDEWSHVFVQSQFSERLIKRRKLYPGHLRRVLQSTIEIRQKADYTSSPVSERVARQALHKAEEFVKAIEERVLCEPEQQ